MGDGGAIPRLGNMKAFLGIVAGAGASYGIYKLISTGSFKRNKKSANNESPAVRTNQPSEVTPKPGSLLDKVSGLDVVFPRPVDSASGKSRRSYNTGSTADTSYIYHI